MKKHKGLLFLLILIGAFLLINITAYAAPTTLPIPKIDISVDNAGTPKNYVDNIKLLIMLTVISLLPSFLVMMTSFTRIIVVLGFVKSALGTQQAPPNQVLIGLALFLTVFIMTPTFKAINKDAVQPFLENKINQEQAMDNASKPIRNFMLKETNKDNRMQTLSEARTQG